MAAINLLKRTIRQFRKNQVATLQALRDFRNEHTEFRSQLNPIIQAMTKGDEIVVLIDYADKAVAEAKEESRVETVDNEKRTFLKGWIEPTTK